MNDFENENKRLQAKVHSLSNANHILQHKLSEYDEMYNKLVTALGFSGVAEAMNSIIGESQALNSEEPMDQDGITKRLEEALSIQFDAVKAAEIFIHSIDAELQQTRQELSRLVEENERIRHERYAARKEAERYATDAQTWRMELETKLPEMQSMLRNMQCNYSEKQLSTATKNPDASGTNASGASTPGLVSKDEHEQLKMKFQALLASKTKVSEKYQQDLLKWKRFKKWVVQGEVVNGETRVSKLMIRRRKSNDEIKHSQHADMSDPFVAHQHLNIKPGYPKHVEESLTQLSEFPSSQTIHGILPSPESKEKDPILLSPSSSKELSLEDGTDKAGSDHLSFRDEASVLVRNDSTQSCPAVFGGNDKTSKRSMMPINQSLPVEKTEAQIILVPDTQPSDGNFAPSRQKKQSEVPTPREASIATGVTETILIKTPENQDIRYNNREFFKYAEFKGRGRYSAAKQHHKTSSTRPELDQDLNCVDDSARDKNLRKMLKGGDCECCREYYEMLKPLPMSLAPPLWRSPSTETSPKGKCVHDSRKKQIGFETEAHKKEISRHRFRTDPATTPPNFWKIGFPNTQEVEDINRRADDMHVRKYQRIDKDFKKDEMIKRRIHK